ncbi:MAG: response regulator [Thermoplasmatota archaeon]|nr:response regulator [Halobacteriales archaeon]
MTPNAPTPVILMAEDDEDDYVIARDVFADHRIANELRWVKDGQELLDYLRRKGKYADSTQSPDPGLILLDLNMPRKDGREALKEIKSDPHLRRIPVVILTTSKAEEDIFRSYDLGVNSFIQKPVDFQQFVAVVKSLTEYWLQIVQLPPKGTIEKP